MIARNWTLVLSLPRIDGAITSPSAAITPRRPIRTSSRPTITRDDPRRDALGAEQRDQHAGDEQLVRGRVQERADLARHVPAAREVPVDPVGRRGDGEEDRGQRGRVVAVVRDQDQAHDHRREHDPQHRAGGDEAGRAESAPGHGRGRHERAEASARRARQRGRRGRRRAPSRPTARSAAFTAGIRLGAMLSSRTPSPASCTAASGSPASSPHTPTQRPCASAAATTCAMSASTGGRAASSRPATRRVAALGGHRVLREVVRADREEVDLARERARRRGRARGPRPSRRPRAAPRRRARPAPPRAARAPRGARRAWPPSGTSP